MSFEGERLRVRIFYTNHRGVSSWRTIDPMQLRYGSCEWHPGEQWLLEAFDADRGAPRLFAMDKVHSWEAEPGIDELANAEALLAASEGTAKPEDVPSDWQPAPRVPPGMAPRTASVVWMDWLAVIAQEYDPLPVAKPGDIYPSWSYLSGCTDAGEELCQWGLMEKRVLDDESMYLDDGNTLRPTEYRWRSVNHRLRAYAAVGAPVIAEPLRQRIKMPYPGVRTAHAWIAAAFGSALGPPRMGVKPGSRRDLVLVWDSTDVEVRIAMHPDDTWPCLAWGDKHVRGFEPKTGVELQVWLDEQCNRLLKVKAGIGE